MFCRLVGLVLVWLMLGPVPASAHTPDQSWSCFNGQPQADADTVNESDDETGWCFFHWPDAYREWHFASSATAPSPTSTEQSIALTATNPWMTNHALWYNTNSNAASHVYKINTSTGAVAAGIATSYASSSQHILAFDVYWNEYRRWNLSTAASHGTFTSLDLLSVLTHEWGHVIGFGHSTVALNHDCLGTSAIDNSWATMTPAGCLGGGHTEQRTLTSPDIYARCQVYSHAHGYAC